MLRKREIVVTGCLDCHRRFLCLFVVHNLQISFVCSFIRIVSYSMYLWLFLSHFFLFRCVVAFMLLLHVAFVRRNASLCILSKRQQKQNQEKCVFHIYCAFQRRLVNICVMSHRMTVNLSQHHYYTKPKQFV